MLRPIILALSFLSVIVFLSLPSRVAAQAKYIVQPVAEMKVKQLPKGELFWHVESFPTLDKAKAAAPPYRWNPDTVSYDGRSYRVYKSGSYIAFVDTENVTSGTLNLLSFFNYIIGKGWISASSTLGAIDYGVELVSTNGMDATFVVDGFSLTTN